MCRLSIEPIFLLIVVISCVVQANVVVGGRADRGTW